MACTARALAVGVRENRSEKAGCGGVGYKLSRPIVNDVFSAAMTMVDRDDARALVILANKNNSAPPFSSFFNTLMIRNLLLDKTIGTDTVSVAGVGFYPSVVPNTNFSTHIGAVFSNPLALQRITANPSLSHIQSDMACPGSLQCAGARSAGSRRDGGNNSLDSNQRHFTLSDKMEYLTVS